MAKEQKRFNVTFRDNKKELELYSWVKEKGQVGSISSYIKTILYREMQKEMEGK